MNLITKKIHLLGLLLVLHSSYALSMEITENNDTTTTTKPDSTKKTEDSKFTKIDLAVEKDISFDLEKNEKTDDQNKSKEDVNSKIDYTSQPYGGKNKQPFSSYHGINSPNANNFLYSTIKELQDNIARLHIFFGSVQADVNKLKKKDTEENTAGSITQGDAEQFGDNVIIQSVDYRVNFSQETNTLSLTKKENQTNSGVYTKEKIIVKDVSKGFGQAISIHTKNQANIRKHRNNQQFYTNAATMCKSIFYAATTLTAGVIGGSIDYSKIQNAQLELKDVKPKLLLVGGLMSLTGISWLGSKFCSKKAIKIDKLINDTELADKKVFKNIANRIYISEE